MTIENGRSVSLPVAYAAGSVAAQFGLSSRVALEASAGSLLPDLYQGFPASGFVSVGVRLFLTPRPPMAGHRSGDAQVLMAVREGAEAGLRVPRPGGALLDEAAGAVAAEPPPPAGIPASAALRRELAGDLLRRVMGRLGAA